MTDPNFEALPAAIAWARSLPPNLIPHITTMAYCAEVLQAQKKHIDERAELLKAWAVCWPEDHRQHVRATLVATFDTMTKDGQGLSRSQVDTILAALDAPGK